MLACKHIVLSPGSSRTLWGCRGDGCDPERSREERTCLALRHQTQQSRSFCASGANGSAGFSLFTCLRKALASQGSQWACKVDWSCATQVCKPSSPSVILTVAGAHLDFSELFAWGPVWRQRFVAVVTFNSLKIQRLIFSHILIC